MFRNNILLTFSNYNNISEIGIYKEKKSRKLIRVEDIDLINNITKQIARKFLNWLTNNNICNIYNYEKDIGFFNHIALRNNENNEYLIELYLNKPNNLLLEKLKEFDYSKYNIKVVYYQDNNKKNNFRGNFNLLYGDKYLKYNICQNIIGIKAGCFFQTNNQILQIMYKDIINILTKNLNYNFLDLYCGVGILSLLMNNYYNSCLGIEINKNAIEIANYNKLINNKTNCNFVCNPVEDIIEEINLDNIIIFINPPRRGLYENVIQKINKIKAKIKEILYLSCCKKTLDRDLKLFNFKSKLIKTYDMFPKTNHKEYLIKLY